MAAFHPLRTLATHYGLPVCRDLQHFEARLLKAHYCASNTTIRGVAVRLEQRSFVGLRERQKLGVGGNCGSVDRHGAGVALADCANIHSRLLHTACAADNSQNEGGQSHRHDGRTANVHFPPKAAATDFDPLQTLAASAKGQQMRRFFTSLGVGYAGTALLVLATLPIMYAVPDRRLGVMLCVASLTTLFVLSMAHDASQWHGTYLSQAARSAKWCAAGFSVLLLVALIVGQVP